MYYTALHRLMPLACLFLFIWTGMSHQGLQAQATFQEGKYSAKVYEQISQLKRNGENFVTFNPFLTNPKSFNNQLFEHTLHDATFLDINYEVMDQWTQTPKGQMVKLVLPFASGGSVELELMEVENFDASFTVSTSSGETYTAEQIGARFYRGVGANKEFSLAAFTVFDNQIVGMFSDETGNYILSPTADNTSHIFYNDEDLKTKSPFECGAEKLEAEMLHLRTEEDEEEGDGFYVEKCIPIYVEVDYALFQSKGSAQEAARYMAATFNNVAALFHNESVTVTLSQIHVWTTPDPYNRENAALALNQFRSLRPTYNGTLAHLAALGGNNLGGVAWLDVICFPNFRYGYSNIHADYQNIPVYSWTVMVIAHEIGHNLGSRHTQWCGWPGGPIDNCFRPEGACNRGPAPDNGGTIMSYCHLTSAGINFAHGFGPLPGDRIRHRINQAPCLESCFINENPICQRPGGVRVENITFQEAALSWIPVSSADKYHIEYKITSDTNGWQKIKIDTSFIRIQNLEPASDYLFRVFAECDSTTMSEPSALFSFKTAAESAYCQAMGQSARLQWISLFELGEINRVSGDDGGYFDGTHLSTTLEPGKSYILKFKSDVLVGPVTLFWRMWIDYDGNGSFADDGELVFSRVSNSSNPMARAIHIPENVKPGTTRLRIALKYGSHAGACEVFAEGEVEDYTVHIAPKGNFESFAHQNGGSPALDVWPNPVSRDLILSLRQQESENGQLSIINTLGQVVHQEKVDNLHGEYQQVLDLESLKAGTYSLVFNFGNRVMQHKFVKL